LRKLVAATAATRRASAVYGSGAVGGVVNIITDRKFEGINVSCSIAARTELLWAC